MLLASTTPSDPYVDDVILRKIIPRIEKRPKEVLTEANKVKYPHERFTVYTFGKTIYKDSKVIGYIIYQLYEEDMQNLIFVRDTEVVVITDQYDRIIVATSNIIRGLMNKFAPQYVNSEKHVKIKDGVYYMDKKTLPMAPINIYTLAPMSYNGPMFIFYGGFILLVSLFLYYLMNYLADKMSIQNSAAIDKLLHGVYELQKGNMRSYVDINTGDEFEILANQYNIMLDRLNELANRNKELSDIRRIKEIKQLQAQFNPHFIFNILETLRYTIVIDPKQAQDIVMTLSNLLRYSIGNDGQDVLVKDDLEYIEDYLRLHKIRFNERLTYNIDVPEEVKNAYVPKLLLQAIIENSIKYGYKEKEFLTINVTGDIVNGHIVLEVKDNGTGMTKEQLIRVKDMLQKPQNKTKHIGLYNVHRRLVLLYGEEYGLNIKSSYEKGTYVSILIPYGKDGNNV